ncbi:ethanolamine utilization protein EutN [Dethiosulfatibacter aminovorans DSM 17477]|uniref:Ethanolamine utilization protein EutN n=1 Tax=Dethiosulfatibacter aminovorans DSM 17477 TaxID=1121476 RepID=A0A1M6DQA9_9FIRM|nr:EutN/CcmL family microcompartment protein [Dethiosulfatibacter aminovorans]SHI75343.1 ethanolamine utilization protein EutN [Dethiosulfatibacter aminovorans DSM 17477]
MQICKVIGNVWATRKEESLKGTKMMVVKETETSQGDKKVFVAIDVVGSGIGERVLVVKGSPARLAIGRGRDIPIDCAIVGIIDSLEISED